MPDVLWRNRAACLGADDAIFFPSRPAGEPGGGDMYQTARAICHGCPVTAECLTNALVIEALDGKRWGMRGGLTPNERDRVAKQQEQTPTRQELTAAGHEQRMQLWLAGESDTTIAAQLGVNATTITIWRRKHALPTNYPEFSRPHTKGPTHATRLRLWRQGCSDEQIGNATGATRRAIYKWRARHGLKAPA